jgi:uncharacterized protein YodC (DUF2158 family)
MPKVGDTVRLKSGGPLMTINGKGSGDHFHCSWFVEGDPKEHKGLFRGEALKVVPDDDEEPRK